MEGHEYERLKARLTVMAEDWLKEKLVALRLVFQTITGEVVDEDPVTLDAARAFSKEVIGKDFNGTIRKNRRGRPSKGRHKALETWGESVDRAVKENAGESIYKQSYYEKNKKKIRAYQKARRKKKKAELALGMGPNGSDAVLQNETHPI